MHDDRDDRDDIIAELLRSPGVTDDPFEPLRLARSMHTPPLGAMRASIDALHAVAATAEQLAAATAEQVARLFDVPVELIMPPVDG